MYVRDQPTHLSSVIYRELLGSASRAKMRLDARTRAGTTLTETEFNLTMTIAFVATVIIVTFGFNRFLKWRRDVISDKPSLDDLVKRANAIDAKYRAAHPEIDEDFEGVSEGPKAD